MRMARKKIKTIFNSIPFILVGAAILIVAIAVTSFLKNSPYFNIDGMFCSEQDKLSKIEKLLKVKGKNIFSVNLKEVSRVIQEKYPGIFEISVTRVFPNKLRVAFKERIPLAKLSLPNNNFVIDNEAVILKVPEDFDDSVLPVINGSFIAFKDLKTGQKIKSKNLNVALSILEYMSSPGQFKKYKVTELDTANVNKISFMVDSDIQIIVREEDFKEKLKILNSLFDQLSQKVNNIKYIDLRFKDPIINYKKK
ncbi:MAG: FtsQ-type POTRA domain-containing protein [Candidatus Omnitrophica bacterium]|nr:FtsQ-type POTRA domain-containing protein [Candidatus Omnitrophota bacterium]